MARLKLRTFSIALILVSASLGMALNFSSDFLGNTGTEFGEEDEITQLRSGFANESSTITDQRKTTQDVGIDSEFFFLSEIWQVITTVVGGVGEVLNLIASAAGLTGLSIPDSVLALSSIFVVGVIFAVVSAARGWDV